MYIRAYVQNVHLYTVDYIQGGSSLSDYTTQNPSTAQMAQPNNLNEEEHSLTSNPSGPPSRAASLNYGMLHPYTL